MSECKKHGIISVEFDGNTGAPIDGYCYQCDIDTLREENERLKADIEKVKRIAHQQVNEEGKVATWNKGFKAGVNAQGSTVAELELALDRERNARQLDNADLTEQILTAEARVRELEEETENRLTSELAIINEQESMICNLEAKLSRYESAVRVEGHIIGTLMDYPSGEERLRDIRLLPDIKGELGQRVTVLILPEEDV